MSKNLVIVESPAKAKTIEGYLGKDFKVVSSYGHVRDLPKGDKAIDIEHGFAPTYEVTDDKKNVIRDLKKLAKTSETIYLASDDDREGEAISWHLMEALDLKEQSTKRIVFREITKRAIQNAIANPRAIDIDLVNAQQARRILDRLVGFELSPILWKKIKYGLSAGRVQSVAVRLVVERERDIIQHNAISSFKITAHFKSEGRAFRAELPKKFNSEEEAKAFLNSCVNADYSIQNLETKPAKRSPAPPFTTSTLQQEASRKLSFSVGQTMQVAQKLYEAGKITYMRTDSVNLSGDAIKNASAEITHAYGSEFVQNRTFKNKSSSAQEAHEAIRPSNFASHSAGSNYNEERLYDLIWKRAIASQMADAQLEKTTATIGISTTTETLRAQGEMIKFEGFLKVYIESTDDEEDESQDTKGMLPPLTIGQDLALNQMIAKEGFSRASARFTEASLVKKLEEMGIGRPSTYAPTISTIQKRDYVVKENREGVDRKYQEIILSNNTVDVQTKTEVTGAEKAKLFPTNIAMVVNDYLVKNFDRVIDYSFTADVEQEFDKISQGQQEWNVMIENFYGKFHEKVLIAEEGERGGEDKHLGSHPESGNKIIARLGRFGPMVQIGETNTEDETAEKPQYASLRKDQYIDTITLEEALDLFKLPRTVGTYEEQEVVAAIGRFGPYIRFDEKFISLPKDVDPLSIKIDEAIELIKEKRKADAPIYIYKELPVQKGKGRFGPFIKWNNMFINVNKKYDWDNLSEPEIVELIEDKIQKEIDKVIHNWEEEGIRVEKARWGRHNILKGKVKIELPKTVDVSKMTLEKVLAIIEKNAPKKKKAAKKKPASKKKK